MLIVAHVALVLPFVVRSVWVSVRNLDPDARARGGQPGGDAMAHLLPGDAARSCGRASSRRSSSRWWCRPTSSWSRSSSPTASPRSCPWPCSPTWSTTPIPPSPRCRASSSSPPSSVVWLADRYLGLGRVFLAAPLSMARAVVELAGLHARRTAACARWMPSTWPCTRASSSRSSGPSGCGKTTTLNLIAGFVEPDRGARPHRRRGRDGPPAHLRGLGVVFQSYALFPHLYRVRERGLRAARAARLRRGDQPAGAPRRSRWCACEGRRAPAARGAVRRHAAAGGPGARAGLPAARAAARRAAGRARPQAPRGDARRAARHPAPRRHHHGVRHPRPGGGARALRPDRGDERRADRAARRAARDLRAPGHRASSPTSSAPLPCCAARPREGTRWHWAAGPPSG